MGAEGAILHTGDSGLTWTRQAEALPMKRLHAIQALSASQAWAVGVEGLMLRTGDGGLNWVNVRPSAPTHEIHFGLHFSDPSTGLVVGYLGRVFKTTDGGATWAAGLTQSEAGAELRSVAMVGQRGWVAGLSGEILRTVDGGDTWTVPSTPCATRCERS